MACVGRDLQGDLVPAPWLWAGTPSNRLGCSKPYSAWLWTLTLLMCLILEPQSCNMLPVSQKLKASVSPLLHWAMFTTHPNELD